MSMTPSELRWLPNGTSSPANRAASASSTTGDAGRDSCDHLAVARRPWAVGLVACQVAVAGAAVAAAATRQAAADAKLRHVLSAAGVQIADDREQCPSTMFKGMAVHGLPCQRLLTATSSDGATFDRVQAALVSDGWSAYCGPRKYNGATVLGLEASDHVESVVVISQPGSSDLVLAYTRWHGSERLSCR